jgi:gas vesicle protein
MLGAIAGILYAPKAGKKTQEDMRRYYFQMKDNILENMGEIKDISKETYENVVDSVVAGYEEAKIITSWEAFRVREDLKAGYARVKELLDISRAAEK